MSALILIVDDSPIQRKVYAALMKSGGYEVALAENGIQGVEMALDRLPALILMDISMPEMDGIAATYELRQHEQMANVPIIAITATTNPSDVEQAYQAGYTDVVDKSGDKGALLEAIRRFLQ